ncbi:MAG: hypothetical protein GXO93_04265, partial [FCB group bacterium]|nr:hypothetical protein [FCB group bacterium]
MLKCFLCFILFSFLQTTANAYDFVGYINGENAGDEYGSAMCTVDFNADGFADLVVSAPAADDAGTSSGKIYIYFGGPAADTVADLTIVGAPSSFFGKALASAGDFNHDGYEDLLVGAPFYDSPASNAGAVYLYYGGPSPDTTVDHIFTGENTSDYFGIATVGVGDFNHDGSDDIAIGAYKSDWGAYTNSGKVYIYFGGQNPDFSVDKILVGSADGERFGYALTAQDFNGDNIPDVAVGAYSFDNSSLNVGRIYVFDGGTAPDTVFDLTITGSSSGDKFGWTLTAGKINNDSYYDLIMGTDGYAVDTFATGKIYIYDGGSSFDNIEDDSYSLERMANDYFGFSVASNVDINEDGMDEIIAGMPGNDDGAIDGGGAILFLGNSSISIDTTVLGDSQNEEMGKAVCLWKDFGNSSTYIVAVGASSFDNYQGKVALYRQSNASPNNPPVLDSIGPKNVYVGSLLAFQVTASDADGTIPILS